MKYPDMKWIVYRYCIPCGLIICLAFIAVGILTPLKWQLILTVIGGILSFIYFVQKQRLEEMRLFKELFTEFNARYDDLNEDLNKICQEKDNTKPLGQNQIDLLYNYFNLCGEEYFYYKQGFIYPKVWKAWRNGMKIFYRNKRIKDAWAEELNNGDRGRT